MSAGHTFHALRGVVNNAQMAGLRREQLRFRCGGEALMQLERDLPSESVRDQCHDEMTLLGLPASYDESLPSNQVAIMAPDGRVVAAVYLIDPEATRAHV